MTDLIACLSIGKGTWGLVSKLIASEEWGKIFLISNDFGKERYTNDKAFEMIVVNSMGPIEQISAAIKTALEGKFTDLEVAVNIISGSGKEHMALLSALHKLGVGYRLVTLNEEGAILEL